jgi:hypothetical protein
MAPVLSLEQKQYIMVVAMYKEGKGVLEWRMRRWWRSVTPRPTLSPLLKEAFPVYPLIWHPCRTRRTRETDPEGRVIGVEYTFDYQPSEPDFQAELGKNDVVWIPLYTGTIDVPATTEDCPRREYEANIETIKILGPAVRALLVGNANAEICYKVSREEEWEKTIAFVEKHGAIIRPFGRPAFAPIFELLMHDCYLGSGRLRDVLLAQEALVLSFAGCWWLFENKKPKIPENYPYPELSAYLKTLPIWSGVGLQKGLDAGSDRVLSSVGYSAGFMGYF